LKERDFDANNEYEEDTDENDEDGRREWNLAGANVVLKEGIEE